MRSAALEPGTLLDGRYRIERHIGSGGMGQVYAATRLSLGDQVAIKCIAPERDTPEGRARFLREARAMARIRHPNVAQVFDFGESGDGPPFLVMELLDGQDLGSFLRAGPMPLERAVRIFVQICRAVEAGHRRGVVHRDLKPNNVMLARSDDARVRVKVLDFGLARFVSDDDASRVTGAAGGFMGTAAYMSPEQVESADAGTPSDIWSLGVLLYELVTGTLPFRGSSPVATIMLVLEGEFEPASERVPGLPEGVDDAIEQALVLSPAGRPASAMDLAQTLLGALEDEAAADFELPHDAPDIDPGPRPTTDPGSRASQTPVPEDPFARAVFCGSDDELQVLEDARTRAREGEPQVTVVLGPPGVGRSVLLEAYAARARRAGAAVFAGRFFAYEGDRPPPNETFLWMLGQSTGDSDALGGRPVGADARGSSAGEDDGGRWRASEDIVRRFEARAGDRPIVLLLDDAHWATGLELDFIAYLLRPRPGRRLHVVVTALDSVAHPNARSELSSWLLRLARHHPRARSTVALAPWSEPRVREWLQMRLGRVRVQPGPLRRLVATTGGNPHHLEEVLRQLFARGALRREEHGWGLEIPESEVLPESVSHALLANLEGIESDVRAVLESASVVGEEVRFETVQAVTELDEDALEDALERAITHGVLTDRGTSSGADYRFRNPAVRSVLYDAIPRRKRRRLHARVVAALERLYHADLRRISKVLCLHHHATEDWPQTVRWGLEAAEATLDRFDADAAEASLDRADEALEQMAQENSGLDAQQEASRRRLQLLRGALFARLGRSEAASRMLRQVDLEARASGALDQQLRANLALAEAELGRGELRAALEVADRAAELAEAVGDADAGARATVQAADLHARLGEYDEALGRLAPLLDAAATRPGTRALALRTQGWVESRLGDFARAEARAREAASLARTQADPLAEYYAVSLHALALGEKGGAEASLPLYEQALAMTRALSLRRREMIETANMAMSLLSLGRKDEALSAMLQTRALCVELGDRASEGDSNVGLAQVLLARGEVEQAVAALVRGRALCDETGRAEYAVLATLELGEAEMQRSRPGAAREWFEDALTRLEHVDSHQGWRAHAGLARALAADPTRVEAARARARIALEAVAAQRAVHTDPAFAEVERTLEEILGR